MDYIYAELDKKLLDDVSDVIYFGTSTNIPTQLDFEKTFIEIPSDIFESYITYEFELNKYEPNKHLIIAYPTTYNNVNLELTQILSAMFNIISNWKSYTTIYNDKEYVVYYSTNVVMRGRTTECKFKFIGGNN